METRVKAKKEDRHRASTARKSLQANIHGVPAPRWIRCLIRKLEQSAARKRRDPTPASMVSIRHLRIRIIGHLWKLIASGQGARATTVHITPEGWDFTTEELAAVDPRRLLAELRAALYRAGAGSAQGYLILFLDAEFAIELGVFRIHVHGVAGGEMIAVVDRLRHRKRYRSVKPYPARVVINRLPLRNLPYPLTYLLKPDWFARWSGVNDADKSIKSRKQRVKEPYGTAFRAWLNRWKIDDLCLRIHLTVDGDGFKITKTKAYKKGGFGS